MQIYSQNVHLKHSTTQTGNSSRKLSKRLAWQLLPPISCTTQYAYHTWDEKDAYIRKIALLNKESTYVYLYTTTLVAVRQDLWHCGMVHLRSVSPQWYQ